MRPTLLTWRAVRIPSYVTMLYLGLLAGTYSAYAAGRAGGMSGERFMGAILLLLVPAMLGARLAFVASRWPAYRSQLRRIVLPGNEGGAVAYGALLSVPVSVPILMALGLPFAAFWDAGAYGFLAAIICLRIGCFLNGCCCGVIAGRIPTQLLEASWAAVLLVGALVVADRMPFAGALFVSALAAYAAGRFLIEFGRDAPRRLGRLTVAQVYSATFVLLSVTFLAVATWVVG
jgi:phosphatidylglycerol---prolipoprotein diacylglyceryl transferase